MVGTSEIMEIDWENPDVVRLLNFYRKRFALLREHARLKAEQVELKKKVAELEKLLDEKPRGSRRKRSRSTRTKDHSS